MYEIIAQTWNYHITNFYWGMLRAYGRYLIWPFFSTTNLPSFDRFWLVFPVFGIFQVICGNFWWFRFFGVIYIVRRIFLNNFLVKRPKSIKNVILNRSPTTVAYFWPIFAKFSILADLLSILCSLMKILVFLIKCTSTQHEKMAKQLVNNLASG